MLPLLLLVGIALGILYGVIFPPEAVQKPRSIPGITENDIFVKGCVSCHVANYEEKVDFRITTIMKEWSKTGYKQEYFNLFQQAATEGIVLKGKHEFKFNSETSIPEECNKCHGKAIKTALPLGQVIHIIHFSGENNHFIAKYNGECTHCHKIEKVTGTWSSINGRESEIK